MASTSLRASLKGTHSRAAAHTLAFASIVAAMSAACSASKTAPLDAELAGDGGLDASVDAGPAPEPVALADFCASFQEAACDVAERCGCGAPAVARCRSALWDGDCGGGVLSSDMDTAIAEGRVVYDPVAAGRVIADARRAPPACGYGFDAFGFTQGDVFTYDGIFTGTLAPGTPCTSIEGSLVANGCAGGYCFGGRCAEVVDIGGTCGATTQVCFDFDVPLSGNLLRATCREAPGATSGTCEAWLPAGSNCTYDSECISGGCVVGLCIAPRPEGGRCDADRFCASQRCLHDPVTYMGTCLAEGGAVDGTVCTTSADCASLTCIDGACMPRLCGGYAEPAPTPVP